MEYKWDKWYRFCILNQELWVQWSRMIIDSLRPAGFSNMVDISCRIIGTNRSSKRPLPTLRTIPTG